MEARRDAIKASILEEELQHPALSREQILFWFERFRQKDVSDPAYQRQIIDNFVNSVYIFEDRVVLNFNFKENAKTVPLREVLGSSADGNGPPSQTCSNTSRCSGTFFVYRKFCVAAAGQPQLHKTIKGRASGKGVLPFIMLLAFLCIVRYL